MSDKKQHMAVRNFSSFNFRPLFINSFIPLKILLKPMPGSTKTILAFTFMFFCISGCHTQTKEDQIRQIRISYLKINNDRSLKTIKLENEDFLPDEAPDGGCSLTGYYKNDTLYKMSAWIGISYCVRQYDFYLNNGKPVFIFETERDFPEKADGTLDYNTLKPAFEGRYYLDDEKVIDIKLKGEKRSDEKPTSAYVKGLVTEAASYKKLLYQHLKKGK
jgi:hypothetical protein